VKPYYASELIECSQFLRDFEWTVSSPHDLKGTDKAMMKKLSDFFNKQSKGFTSKPEYFVDMYSMWKLDNKGEVKHAAVFSPMHILDHIVFYLEAIAVNSGSRKKGLGRQIVTSLMDCMRD
jgi:hypothetical protein